MGHLIIIRGQVRDALGGHEGGQLPHQGGNHLRVRSSCLRVRSSCCSGSLIDAFAIDAIRAGRSRNTGSAGGTEIAAEAFDAGLARPSVRAIEAIPSGRSDGPLVSGMS